MRIIKIIAVVGGVFILIVVVIALLFYMRQHTAYITVRNNSNSEITNAEILMEEGQPGQGIFIGQIINGKDATIKLPHRSENSIKLTYKDSLNQRRFSEGVYVGGSGGYHIFFNVTESGIKTDVNYDLIPYPPYRTRKKEYKITQLSEYWKDTTIYNTQMVLPNG
ncbi:MAG: hypothetical protein AAB038_05700 [Planctomycetota bacterium]